MEKAGWKFEVQEATDSHYIPKDHPVAQRLTQVFNAVAGEEKQPYVLDVYKRQPIDITWFLLYDTKNDEL